MMIVLRLVYGLYEWQICTQLLRFMLFELGIWVIRASGKSVRRFNFFDSFCFNRIHCNFHYWAWLSLVYGSYEQVANLYTVITFVDRLIWLRHTSSQKIYVCFGRFLTALGYYRKWLCFKGIHCNLYFATNLFYVALQALNFLHMCTMISFGGFLAECLPCWIELAKNNFELNILLNWIGPE